MHVKYLNILLVICLLAGLFAGCGSTSAPPSSAAAQPGAASQSDSTSDAAPEVSADPFAEKLTISWMGPVPPLEDNSWGEQKFEELFNVDVQIIRAEDDQQQAVLFASGSIPDYINVLSIARVAALQSQGVLASFPIEEIQTYMPEYYKAGLGYDPLIFNYATIDGGNYAIPQFDCLASIPTGTAIRADWLKNVGITKVPSTLEELEAAFIAFREQDPNKNGQKDTYALTSFSEPDNPQRNPRMFASIFGAYGVNPFMWREASGGGVEFGFNTQDFKDGLKLLAKWYSMELIDPEFITDKYRTSSADMSLKFATGRVGYLEGITFDDYQIDNDGHVSAKWVPANQPWMDYFNENADADDLYKYATTTDFDDNLIEPYYINLKPVTGPNGKSGYYKGSNIRGFYCFGSQLEDDPAKRARIMSILEAESTDPEIYINHFGPEGAQWIWSDDSKTERIYNPNYTEHPDYHPQGQKLGVGWDLYPIYWCKPEFLTIVAGPRQIQRYTYTMPMFEEFSGISEAVPVPLPAAAENPDLTAQFVVDYIVKAIRGEVDIDGTYDSTIATWKQMGGEALTKEANDWFASIQ